ALPILRIDANVRQAELATAMEKILTGRDLDWYMEEDAIVIAQKSSKSSGNKGLLLQHQVSGRVTNESGLPLEGVTVMIKGGGAGTMTASDGSYRIYVPNGSSVLVFSSVGYRTAERIAGNQRVIHVMLDAQLSELEEIVVIGYGEVSRKDLTG